MTESKQREENEQDKSAEDKPKNEKEKKSEDKDEQPSKPPPYKRPAVLITTGIVLLVLIAGGLLYWSHARHYVSTDDAYVDGHITQISPQISGLIAALHIADNQLVHRGDLLVEIDPTNYIVALEQAQAQVENARGRLAQAEAQIESAEVTLDNTTKDLQRYQAVDTRARSQQQLDNAVAAQRDAQANVTRAKAAAKAGDGELAVALAGKKRAEVDLGYCRIVASTDGRMTQRTIEPGAFLQAGQIMFALVAPDVWVTANFKETQLTNMRPGQPVTLEVDAFPGRKFQGRVDSIQAGSGSRFSVLPAENATGNFVKIVQRVPVKIMFTDLDSNTNDVRLLSPGLSVIPRVKVL